MTKFSIFSDPTRKLSAVLPELRRITTLLLSAKCTRPLFQGRTGCGGRPSGWHDIVTCQSSFFVCFSVTVKTYRSNRSFYRCKQPTKAVSLLGPPCIHTSCLCDINSDMVWLRHPPTSVTRIPLSAAYGVCHIISFVFQNHYT